MKDADRGKEQLLKELGGLRERLSQLEAVEAEHVQAEEALDKSEKYFRLLIENALDLITLLDREGRVIYNSPSLKRILGYEPYELNGRNVFELLHPEDIQTVVEIFESGMQTPGSTEYVEYRFRHKDGSWRSFESIGNNLLHDPAVNGIVVNSRDITDRKQMEDQLKKSEEYFRALIENAMDIIIIINAVGNIIYVNPAVEKLLGHKPEELIGRSSFEFIHPNDSEKALRIVNLAAKDPEFSPKIEFRALHTDGSYRYFEGIGKNYIDHPVVGGIVISFRDISDRKRMERELHERNEELEAFAYTISHDLLTPAAVVEGYAKAALEADIEGRPEAERECLESIMRGARRMSDLIDSLLQYAQAGHLETEISRVDPSDVLQETLMDLKERIRKRRVEVVVGGDMPAVPVDAVKLHQVFLNLIDNALKHMGKVPRPRIEIGARREDTTVVFHVRDNGVGIPIELQKKVFEPFKHFSVSGAPGLGIGLSTVKRAVEAWGGRIWLESKPGEGATFFFIVNDLDTGQQLP